MDQTDLVQGGHAFHHRLHQAAGFFRKQRAAPKGQVTFQRNTLCNLQHRIHCVIGFQHVQHCHQTCGRRDALYRLVQIRKIHAGGFEHHFTVRLWMYDQVFIPA